MRPPNSVFKPYAIIGTNLLFFERGEPTREIWFYEHRVPESQKAYSMTKPIRVDRLKPCVDWWGGTNREGRVDNEFAWRVTAAEVKGRGYNLDFENPHAIADDHGDREGLLAKLNEAEEHSAALRNQLKSILEEALSRLNSAQLVTHFERISEAPDAIPRLRSFILDLAVQGKLVEQNPADEPASELLKRIQEAKTKAVRKREIKKLEAFEPV